MPVKRIGRRDLWQLAGPTPASLPTDNMKKEMEATQTPLLSRVRTMEVGDKIVVPVDAYAYGTVRRYTTDMSFALDRKFTSHLDRATRTYTITRIS